MMIVMFSKPIGQMLVWQKKVNLNLAQLILLEHGLEPTVENDKTTTIYFIAFDKTSYKHAVQNIWYNNQNNGVSKIFKYLGFETASDILEQADDIKVLDFFDKKTLKESYEQMQKELIANSGEIYQIVESNYLKKL